MVLYRQIIIISGLFMIRISKLTDYAMLILTQLARDPATILSATVLSEALHLPAPTVSKILKILCDAEIVISARGAEGGYRLARAANSITIMNIITAMEGQLALTECCEMTSCCAIDHVCTMRENWRTINGMVQALLTKFTILDMIDPQFVMKQQVAVGCGAMS